MTVEIPLGLIPYWPALELVLLGHVTLGDICGGPPSIEELTMLSVANDAWQAAEARARKERTAS